MFVGTKRFYTDEAPQNLANRDRFAFERNQKTSSAITAGKNNKSVSCWVDISILHIVEIYIYICIIHTHRHLDMHTCQYIHISATKHANVIHIGLVEPTETNTSKHRQKVIAAQRSSEIAQIASSVVEPGSAELDNRRVGQPLSTPGGKIPPFCFGQKKWEVCFTSDDFLD